MVLPPPEHVGIAVIIFNLLLAAIALPAVLCTSYLLLLTVLSAAPAIPRCKSRALRFDIIVPAHDEAAVIERTIGSLRRIDWPADRFRILVCADNCTDSTAQHAHAAGAQVLERIEPERRGKGYALSFAFQRSRTDGFADAVVIIDADSEVSANLLEAIAARLERGDQAVQVHYGVLNPLASWRTRLITIAHGSFHMVRSRARERLRLSCGLRGTGWCVTHRLLNVVPYGAFSLTEDVEYGIELGMSGYRVAYAGEAHCNAEMVVSDVIAAPQRARWERGRFQLIRTRTAPLVRRALAQRGALCLDLALDLLVLPLSYIVLNVTVLLLGAAMLALLLPHFSWLWLWLAMGSTAVLSTYVVRGWQLSGIGLRGIADLSRVPQFLVWRVLLLLRKRQPKHWQRTEREHS
jgi:cellulose synthase/poly-beta-1,6-N-acetylglucosamine synthase-like glycosyltransferase